MNKRQRKKARKRERAHRWAALICSIESATVTLEKMAAVTRRQTEPLRRLGETICRIFSQEKFK